MIGEGPGAELLDGLGPRVVEPAELERYGDHRPGAAERAYPTDLAAVLYTSGSTGRPKGVMLSHANLSFAVDSIVDYLELDARDRILCALQLSFSYGLTQLLCSARVGATLVLRAGFAMAGEIIEALGAERITAFPGVPMMLGVLASLPGIEARELPDLRLLTNAGGPLPAATASKLGGVLPEAGLISMYGLAECLRVSYLPAAEIQRRPTSCGVPIPGTEAWPESPDGRRLGPGEVGELIVRGAHVMGGYWRSPAEQEGRLRPGRWPWERDLATGDLFHRDEQGYLYWVGRTNETIKSRGQKVYPRAVEEVLHGIEGVAEAAGIGVADELLGQAVHAHVAAAPGVSLQARALRRSCALSLEPHEVPRRLIFHETLPRTLRGKIDRDAIRAASELPPSEGVSP